MARFPRKFVIRFILLYLLAAAILFIAIRIEYLNTQAGGILPRDTSAIRAEGGNPKWRTKFISKQAWKQHYRGFDDDGKRVERVPTPSESKGIHEKMQANLAETQLKAFVAGYGILQYLLVFVVLVSCVLLLTTSRKDFPKPKKQVYTGLTLPPLVAAIVGAYFMFTRAYLSSLGW